MALAVAPPTHGRTPLGSDSRDFSLTFSVNESCDRCHKSSGFCPDYVKRQTRSLGAIDIGTFTDSIRNRIPRIVGVDDARVSKREVLIRRGEMWFR